jgi:hypothetical protein
LTLTNLLSSGVAARSITMHINLTFRDNEKEAKRCFDLLCELHLHAANNGWIAVNEMDPVISRYDWGSEGVYYFIHFDVPDNLANSQLSQLLDRLKSMR